jgi:hypothetical protein
MMMSARPKRRLVVLAVLGHRWAAVMEAGAAIGSGGLYLLLQLLVGQPRPSPDQVAGPIQLSGFPSGHLATFVAVFGFLAYLGYRRQRSLRDGRVEAVSGRSSGEASSANQSGVWSGGDERANLAQVSDGSPSRRRVPDQPTPQECAEVSARWVRENMGASAPAIA